MTPKQRAQKAHSIAVLFTLLSEYIDDFSPNSPAGELMKLKALEILPLADKITDSVFDIKSIRSSTYINDLANKIDTIIRQNFKKT
jgi:hypothetical protein